MAGNKYSSLTTLRLNLAGKLPTLEVWDPETNSIHSISSKELSSIQSIHNALTFIKSNVQDAQYLTHYAKWLNKGWYKSIDYYLASRSGLSSNPKHDINHNQNTMLPTTEQEKMYSVPQAMIHRKTKRAFRKKTLKNQIFYAGLRSGCSSMYSGYKLYLLAYDVENIAPAVYYYNVRNHSLLLVREGLFTNEMSANIQGMRAPQTACFSIILVADFKNLQQSMPHQRGLRNTYIETGRLAQNLIISYTQYGVFCLVTPALRDRDVSTLLQLKEPDFSPLYSLTFGYPIN